MWFLAYYDCVVILAVVETCCATVGGIMEIVKIISVT